MIDIRSYLVRAWRDWIIDNNLTPYIVVNCHFKGVQLPKVYYKQENITLNIKPSALKDFLLTQEYLSFEAKFDHLSNHIYIPVLAIHGIYAMENNHGMWFNIEQPPIKNNNSNNQNFTLSD